MEDFYGAIRCFARMNALSRAGRPLPALLQASSANSMAGVFLAVGRPATALEAYAVAESLLSKAIGQRHQEVAVSLTGQGVALAAMGDRETAQDYLVRALEILSSTAGGIHLEIARALQVRASIAFGRGETEAAAGDLIRAIGIQRQLGRPALAGLARSLEQLAEVLRATGDEERAENVVEEARAVEAVRPFAANPGAARSLATTGMLHEATGNTESADRCYLRAVVHEDAIGVTARRNQVKLHMKFGRKLIADGFPSRASLRYLRAETMLIRLLEDSPEDPEASGQLAKVRNALRGP